MIFDRDFLEGALSARGVQMETDIAAAKAVCTDTRAIASGDLFVALKGDRFDAHDFVSAALDKGACAALVERTIDNVDSKRLIVVDNALLALQDLAAAHLRRLPATRIGLTGSNGKTTTKELIAAALAGTYGGEAISATVGNLNNHIGLPLTALRVQEHHRAVVLEMGMNHLGEIRLLCQIAEPQIGLLTNIGTAHAGNVGGIEGVAKAKGELFEGLASGSVAVLNLDDPRIVAAAKQTLSSGVKQITYGTNTGDIQVVDYKPVAQGTALTLSHGGERAEVLLPLVGAHNAMNAAGAVATAIAAGCEFAPSVDGLGKVSNVPGRLTVYSDVGGRLVLDDSYNANPDSMQAAFAALVARAKGRRLVAVLGQMLELGDDAFEQHAHVAESAVKAGIKRLFVSGELGKGYVEGARRAGLMAAEVDWAEDSMALAEVVATQTEAGDAMVVKGSRGARMERVVERLHEEASKDAAFTSNKEQD